MNWIPFLIVGVGLAWAGLMLAMRDRAIERRRVVVTVHVDTARFGEAMRRATLSFQQFEQTMAELQRAMAATAPAMRLFATALRREP